MIRAMTNEDWPRVLEIYVQGMLGGTATFRDDAPDFEEWDNGHIKTCRFVSEEDGVVNGFAAISPTSSRACYRGVVEVSIYVDETTRGKGVGEALMRTLMAEAEKQGYWSLYSAIFSINTASIRLHEKCGFKVIGTRENISKDRFGNWQSTTLMEWRNSIL